MDRRGDNGTVMIYVSLGSFKEPLAYVYYYYYYNIMYKVVQI
jgi:hypothetical protein